MTPYIGLIQTFGFSFAPVGWALCNGDLLSIAENSALYALLGTTYGGDGQVTFAIPNLQCRSMIHQGQGPGLSNIQMGEVSGLSNITLSTNNLPAHNHAVAVGVSNTAGEDAAPAGKILAQKTDAFAEDPSSGAVLGGVSEAIAGASQPISIRNPYLGVYHSIALEGIFPSRA